MILPFYSQNSDHSVYSQSRINGIYYIVLCDLIDSNLANSIQDDQNFALEK